MLTIAEKFDVHSIESNDNYPHIEITARVLLGKMGKLKTVDTEGLRMAIENACAVYCLIESAKGGEK